MVPRRGWVEDSALALSPRPSRWEFLVEAPDRQTISVSDTKLRSGQVFRPGRNRSESQSHFDEQTCNGLPFSAGILAVAAVVALGAIASAFFIGLRRRSRVVDHRVVAGEYGRSGSQPAASPPPGWFADPRGRFESRWWDGQQWTVHVSSRGVLTKDPDGI